MRKLIDYSIYLFSILFLLTVVAARFDEYLKILNVISLFGILLSMTVSIIVTAFYKGTK